MFSRAPVPFLFEVFFDSSILVTIAAALAALWLYRRTVLRYMRGGAADASGAPTAESGDRGAAIRKGIQWRPVLVYAVVSTLTVVVVTAELITGDAISISFKGIMLLAFRAVSALTGEAEGATLLRFLSSPLSVLTGLEWLVAWILEPPVLLALGVAVVGLYGYRIAIKRRASAVHRRAANSRGGDAANGSPDRTAGASTTSTGTPQLVQVGGGDTLWSNSAARDCATLERRLQRRLAFVYGAATAAIVAVAVWIEFFAGTRMFTGFATFVMWKWFTEGEVFPLVAYTALYGAIVIPMLAVLMAWTWRRALRLLGLYLLAWVAAIHAVALMFHLPTGQSAAAIAQMASAIMWPELMFVLFLLPDPVLLLLFAGARRLRAVVPMTLAGVLLFVALFLIAIRGAVWAYSVGLITPGLLRVFGHSGVVFLLASVPAGYLSWYGLRALARLYDRKVFSDRQLVFDCWALIVIWYAYPRLAVTEGAPEWLILLGLIAFLLYRYAIQLGLRRLIGPRAGTANRRLLLLRVFGFQRRTERLFDLVAQRWRFTGSVQMITGTDLATRSINPGDFIRFLSGRLQQQFITRDSDLGRHLSAQDPLRDPDGRYRINQLFCDDDRWQEALVAMLDRCEVVLMDLRGFSPAKRGCVFELQQIAGRLPLDNVVLIVDATTDMGLLERTVHDAFGNTSAGTLPQSSQALTLMRIKRHSRREIETLLGLLWGAKPAAADREPRLELTGQAD